MKPFAAATGLLAVISALLFAASLSASPTEALARFGIDPFTTAQECAALFVVALLLTVSPGLRSIAGRGWAWAVALWRRVPEPDKPAGKAERVPNLDILRLIAALSVIALHAAWYGQHRFLWLPFGPVAVFIAISGFVIPGSFSASRSWGHFAWKRFLRIAPALLCCFAMIWIVFGKVALFSALVVYATGGILEGLEQRDGALWSLLTEEVLYAWHGLSQTIRRLWTPRACITAIAVLFLLQPLFGAYAGEWPNILSAMPTLGSAFLLGNLVYFYRSRLAGLRVAWIVAAILLLVMTSRFVPLGHLNSLVGALTNVLIVVLAIRLPQWRWKWTDISYGVYISHVPILSLTAVTYDLHGPGVWLIAYTGAVMIGTISWNVIEKPALSLKNLQIPLRHKEGIILTSVRTRKSAAVLSGSEDPVAAESAAGCTASTAEA